MNDEELKMFKEKLEKEFNSIISSGGDIRSFLYFPHNFLSENIKNYLDEFLLLSAYKEIETGNITTNSFKVYQDPLIIVKLEKKEQQIEILERLIKYFLEREEYEKCAKIQTLLKEIEL